jgi:Asp-tRNA(Asn)/Glu-tRNA(Gln) amidotransferase A subunit family amidase
MQDLESLSASQAIRALTRREIKATDLLLACLDRIGQRENTVRAWTSLGKESALRRAKELDRGSVKGLLHGLPIGVKDIYDTYDLPTSYGSSIYTNHYPAIDAVSIALMRQAGGIILGKTVSTEFASFKSGPTANPHNQHHTPGGSSSGSAAAIADFMVPLATGSQTAGSIIRPASFCGVIGFKPSLGKISTAGVKSLSQTMDTMGCFGRTIGDVGLGVAAMSGDHELATIRELHNKPRLAICKTADWRMAQKETAGALALARFAAEAIAKGKVDDYKLPTPFNDISQIQTRIMTAEISRSLTFEQIRFPKKISPQLTQQLSNGASISYEQYAKDLIRASELKLLITQIFNNEVDVLIAPSAIGEAPATKENTGDPIFCRGWTLLGLPCININITTGTLGLPVGVQLIAGTGKDHLLLSVARAIAYALPDPVARDQA